MSGTAGELPIPTTFEPAPYVVEPASACAEGAVIAGIVGTAATIHPG